MRSAACDFPRCSCGVQQAWAARFHPGVDSDSVEAGQRASLPLPLQGTCRALNHPMAKSSTSVSSSLALAVLPRFSVWFVLQLTCGRVIEWFYDALERSVRKLLQHNKISGPGFRSIVATSLCRAGSVDRSLGLGHVHRVRVVPPRAAGLSVRRRVDARREAARREERDAEHHVSTRAQGLPPR